MMSDPGKLGIVRDLIGVGKPKRVRYRNTGLANLSVAVLPQSIA